VTSKDRKDVKDSTVDRMTKRIVENSNMSADQARKVARESAERVNRDRQQK
jgi:hypothetical protein